MNLISLMIRKKQEADDNFIERTQGFISLTLNERPRLLYNFCVKSSYLFLLRAWMWGLLFTDVQEKWPLKTEDCFSTEGGESILQTMYESA